jgi:hypothetical protein
LESPWQTPGPPLPPPGQAGPPYGSPPPPGSPGTGTAPQ